MKVLYSILLLAALLLITRAKGDERIPTIEELFANPSPSEMIPRYPPAWNNITSNFTNCHNGKFVGNSTTNWCTCDENWGGMDCSMCTSDKVCADGYTCDHSLVVYTTKSFNCVPPPPGVQGLGAVSVQLDFPNGSNPDSIGSVFISAFDEPYGPPFLFNCTLVECTKKTAYDVTVESMVENILCSNIIDCQCSNYCSDLLLNLLPKASGESTVSCQLSTNSCSVFLGVNNGTGKIPFPLVCQAAGCQAKPYEPPAPLFTTVQLVFVIIGGVVLLIGIVGLIAGLCIVVRRSKTREYLRTRFMEEYSVTLAFEDIFCTIGNGKNRKVIVNGASGTCYPGQLTAILGPSGAGKTSFLDILAGRKNVGQLSGHVLVNGAPRKSNFQRISGYVLQDEKLIGTLTVKEHLMFVARLRLPSAMPHEEKEKKVNQVMKELNIEHIQDSYIGTDLVRGISGGEKRRVTIATELVTDPHILFLDEPTSGLDSTSSYSLIQTLVSLSRKNRTVITTIHQPSSNMYHLFDNVILLAKGETVYNGSSADALSYFERLDHLCPANYNPADFLLDLVSMNGEHTITRLAETHRQTYKTKHPAQYDSFVAQNTIQDPTLSDEEAGDVIPNERSKLIRSTSSRSVPHINERSDLQSRYAAYWIDQVWVLSKRTMLNNFRNPSLMLLQYVIHILLGLLLGFIFWDSSYDARGTQDRFGVLFFMAALLAFSAVSSIDLFFHERSIFVRERATGMYSTSAYFLVKAFCDIIPMRVIPSILLGVIPYYMITLNPGWPHVLTLVSILVLIAITATSMCFAISAISPSVSFANLIVVIVMLFNMLFAGFLVNKASLPSFIFWIKYTSFLNYGFEVLCVNEFLDKTINFDPVGYPIPPTPVPGTAFLQQFDMSPSRIPYDYMALGIFSVAHLFIAYLLLRFYVRERR